PACRLNGLAATRSRFVKPARELGRTAVNIMMRLLNDDPDIPAETRLPVEWIGRDSIKIC
ncbi:hypothetical protein PUT90_20765, partial [Klebsiella pneumoniae]|nr:hypothetical protein [Klebsiella pneumoniae]